MQHEAMCHMGLKYASRENKSERPVDALAVKNINYWATDNLKSRDASASKKWWLAVLQCPFWVFAKK